MTQARIRVICALVAEARTLAHQDTVVTVCGMGGQRAACAARSVLAHRPKAVVSWGIAGGLDPDLTPGALLVPDRVADEHGHAWQTEAVGGRGLLLSTAVPLATVGEKQKHWHQGGFHAVDMESAAIAAECHDRGVPFLSVRAIADTARCALPPRLADLVHANGRARPAAALAWTAVSPRRLSTLLRYAIYYRRALEALRAAAPRLPEWLGRLP